MKIASCLLAKVAKVMLLDVDVLPLVGGNVFFIDGA
jgi:hypothetical protein